MIGSVPPVVQPQSVPQTPAQPVIRRTPPPTNANAPSIPTQAIPIMIDGVPLEIIQYFNQDIRALTMRDKEQLREIYDIYKNDSQDMGDVLLKISEADRRIGTPSGMDSRWGKLWAYAKLNSRIGELEKQRKAFELNG